MCTQRLTILLTMLFSLNVLVWLLWQPDSALADGPSNTPRQNLWVTDGTVYNIEHVGNTLYIGGDFSYVGPVTGSGVPIDAASGATLSIFPQVNGPVYAAISDGAGGWYIGGNFTQVGNLARNRVAHILANYTVDPAWNPNANFQVCTLAMNGSTVYAGGEFTSIGGQSRNYIAALNAATGHVTAWNPNTAGNSTNPACGVNTLAISGNTVYAGGDFLSIGGQSRNNLVVRQC